MDTAAVQTFSALLALGAVGGILVLVWAMTVGRSTETARGLMDAVGEHSMRLVLLLAGTAMVGSLYFSEAANYSPCKLCWYQRIAMYSVAIVALVAVIRRERTASPYVLVLSLVGLAVSTYHYLVEWFPQIETSVCTLDVPCTTIWFRKFGFLTLPAMAGITFVAVALLMVNAMTEPGRTGETGTDAAAAGNTARADNLATLDNKEP